MSYLHTYTCLRIYVLNRITPRGNYVTITTIYYYNYYVTITTITITIIFSCTYLCKLHRIGTITINEITYYVNFVLAANGTDITGVSTNARFSSYVEDDKEALVF